MDIATKFFNAAQGLQQEPNRINDMNLAITSFASTDLGKRVLRKPSATEENHPRRLAQAINRKIEETGSSEDLKILLIWFKAMIKIKRATEGSDEERERIQKFSEFFKESSDILNTLWENITAVLRTVVQTAIPDDLKVILNTTKTGKAAGEADRRGEPRETALEKKLREWGYREARTLAAISRTTSPKRP